MGKKVQTHAQTAECSGRGNTRGKVVLLLSTLIIVAGLWALYYVLLSNPKLGKSPNYVHGTQECKGNIVVGDKLSILPNGRMESKFTLPCNGTLTVHTKLWSNKKYFGLVTSKFDGCSQILLGDLKKQLWASQVHRFASTDKEASHYWSEEVPSHLLSLIVQFGIKHREC